MKNEVAPVIKVDANGIKEIIYRTGEAAPIELPKAITLCGRIDAPSRFVEQRSVLISKEKAHVLVKRNSGTINLYTDEQNDRQITVGGTLTINPELTAFCINKEKMWALKELLQFLRMRRAHFMDRDVHGIFINRLSDYSASVQKDIELKDDRRGNALNRVEKRVSTDVPMSFKLSMEIYEGFGYRSFSVDVLCDVTDAAVKFWLESVELAELILDERNSIIDNELLKLSDYVIIEA